MKARIFLFTAIVFVFGGCGESVPEEVPADVRIRVHFDGGMVPHSENIDIRADSGFFEAWQYGIENRWPYKIEPEELQALWSELRAAQFDDIRFEEEAEVYDRGGWSIDISYGDQKFDLNDSGNRFILDQDQEQFSSVLGAILEFNQEHIASYYTDFTIYVDSSLAPHLTYLQVMDEGIYNRETDSVYTPYESSLPSGSYTIFITMTDTTEGEVHRKLNFEAGEGQVIIGYEDGEPVLR